MNVSTHQMLKDTLLRRHSELEVAYIENMLDMRRVGSSNSEFTLGVAEPKKKELFSKLRTVRNDMGYLGIPFEMSVDNDGSYHPRQRIVSLVGVSDQERARQISNLVLSNNHLEFLLEGDEHRVVRGKVFGVGDDLQRFIGFNVFDVVSDNDATRLEAKDVRHVVVNSSHTWSYDEKGED